MSLLDLTYFDGTDRSLPQGTYNSIQAHIDQYEREILIQLLGYDLAKLVLAYSVSSDQRIKDIVDGKEYTVDAYTVKWNGLLNTDKVSLLADYVYIKYVTNKQVMFQNTGVVVSATENGVVIGAGPLIQSAGYRLRELAGYPGQDGLAASLYNFLMNNQADYSEWVFNEYTPPNAFDI